MPEHAIYVTQSHNIAPTASLVRTKTKEATEIPLVVNFKLSSWFLELILSAHCIDGLNLYPIN